VHYLYIILILTLLISACGGGEDSSEPSVEVIPTDTLTDTSTITNEAPVIADQAKTNLDFSSSVTFSLTASDTDSSASNYVYSITSQTSHGTVVITNNEASSFEYQPSSIVATSGDSFSVQLSDGENSSAIAIITLSFDDSSAPNLVLSPSNGASNIALTTSFSITSDDPLDITTLNYNSTAGVCVGSVQISKDNFTHCLGIASALPSNLNRLVLLTTTSDLDADTSYKFKVTTEISNRFETNVANNIINTFTSQVATTPIEISGTPSTSINEKSNYSFTPTVDSFATGTAVFNITNKPSWANFSTTSGTLIGIPDNSHIGVYSNITINVTDNIGSSSIGPFEITVNAVNGAPILANQTKSNLVFSSNIAFSLTASDTDSLTSNYVYSITSQTSHGTVVITNNEASSFEYQPSSIVATSGDSFSVQLSDGENSSAIAIITLSFDDSSAPNLVLSPSNGASNIALTTSFSITSDDPLDITTLNYNSTTGVCVGSVQISKDNLTHCLGIASALPSNLNRLVLLTTTSDLDVGTSYKFKVTTAISNLFEINLANNVVNTFTSQVATTPIEISGTPSTSINEESNYNFTPTIDISAIGTAVFSITNKPSWANFSTTTGTLTGIPDDAHIGVYSNITINATDDIGSSSIGPFEITVNAVNDAPILANQTKSNLAFSSNVAFNLSASDVDSPSSSYVYTVISQASHGSVVITNHTTSTFEYQPSSVSGISGDSFTVQVSDGADVSNIRTISLSFSDVSAPAVTLSPNNGAANVAVGTTFLITSDDPLDTATLTYNNSTTGCTGTIQISRDNFTNCIGITSAVASNLNRTITLTSITDLDNATEYKMKVTTGTANLLAVNVASDVSNTFNTAVSDLLITEISESYYNNSDHWFEIYNTSSVAINMSSYSFKSLAYNGSIITATFSLPSVLLQPGQYLVVRANTTGGTFTDTNRLVYVDNAGTYPYWNAIGFIELIKGGITQDFVTFGSSTAPITAIEWNGTFATALPSVANQFGHSLGRNGTNTDTNTAADWYSYSFSTMGGANDVTCTTDADNDGIPDCSEQFGSTFAGLPLYEWGARTGQKDIFIELDYMDSTNGGGQAADEGITPRREALQKVVTSFAAQSIVVHFDVGNLYDQAPGIDAADFDLGGGQEVPYAAGVSFDPVDSRANIFHYKRDYMDLARMQVFHYLLFANSQQADGSASLSGYAEINGNDLIVTLGAWNLNSNNAYNTNALINYQASTLMHELGHNLGLYHGGSNDGNNYEPNYISIMNYMYQLTGLPIIGSDEGDRYYYASTPHGKERDPTCYSGLSNNSGTTTFVIDFSHGNGINLNVASVNETLGLGQASTDGVDFNCDGDKLDTSVVYGAESGIHTDHDDWTNINLNFQRYFKGNKSGVSLSPSTLSDEDTLMPDKVGNDRAPLAEEFAPSAEFFKRLKEKSKL
jgi:hypothetical protein